MPKRPPVIGQQAVAGLLDMVPASRDRWWVDDDVLSALATLEAAARSLMRALKANEDHAYQRLYHGSCPHHMSADGRAFHCDTHHQDDCDCRR